MNRTKIPWCDWTWNPLEGCTQVSEGCANCYAASMARRFGRPWGNPVFHEDRLRQPQDVKKPGRVFVCSTSDLFHPEVCGAGFRNANGQLDSTLIKARWPELCGLLPILFVRDAIIAAPWHTYIILTKRPQNIPAGWLRDPLSVWLGVTCENQSRADERIPLLLNQRASVHFVSVEPMLTPVSLVGYHKRLDWVIAGPETGPKARRCDDAWIDALSAESPCFFDKRDQWTRREFPSHNAPVDGRGASPRTVRPDVGTLP